MKKLFGCSFARRLFKPRTTQDTHSQESKESMEQSSMVTVNDNFYFQSLKENGKETGSYAATNIILNHEFSDGLLHSWHTNCCDGFVVPAGSRYQKGLAAEEGCCYAVVSNRKVWQGLEQDITSRLSTGSSYTVSACVGASGTFQGSVEVLSTLKLVYQNSETSYLFIAEKSTSKECWEILEGSFSLSTMSDQVIFYLEGPPAGTDLLIKSVVISCPSSTACDSSGKSSVCTYDDNIIVNPQFDMASIIDLEEAARWLCMTMADGKMTPMSGKSFASATEHTQSWNGIQQDVTGKVKIKEREYKRKKEV